MKKKTDRTLAPSLSPKLVFLLGVAVPFFLYLFAYIVNEVFPFGGKLLLDADSFHQYLPFLTEFRRKLVGGESLFYSFSGGLGYNFWATIAYYAASPLNLLLVLVPEGNVCDFMVWLSVIKVSLCGGVFAWYLSKQNRDFGLFAVAFGTMYALSSYLLSYKYNIMWLDSIAVVPLVMYGLERIVHGESPITYLLSLFYAIWCNYYMGYIICVFSVLYFIFLLLTEEALDRKSILKSGVSFAVSSLLAGGMAAVWLVPSFLALRQSTAIVDGEKAGFSFYNNVISMFRAHYMESPSFRISYNRGDVHLYCGMAALPLAAIFFTDKTIRKKLRIAYGIFLGFLLLSFTLSPLNYIWHGFHNETGVPNRFSFLYDILLLKLCYLALPNLKKVEESRLNRIILSVLGVSAAFAVWDLIAQHEFKVTLSLGCLALYTVLLYELRSSPKNKKQLSAILCALMVVEAGVWGLIDLSLNGKGRVRSEVIEFQQDFKTLIDAQGEEDFFRSEVDFDSTNFITLMGGNGVSLFNSTMQNSIGHFFGGMNLHSELNMVNDYGGTKLIKDLLGVRYLVTARTDSDTLNGFEKIASLNGKTLYKNSQALPLGFTVSSEILSWAPEPANNMQGHNDLSKILCGEDLFPLVQEFTGKSGEPISFDIPPDGNLYIILDKEPYELTWETPEYSRKYDGGIEYLSLPAHATEENAQATLTVLTYGFEDYTGKIYSCSDEDIQHLTALLAKDRLENIKVNGNCVTGKVSAAEDSILLMTIPYYSKGWQITVDGKPSELQKVAGALIGIPLRSGSHDIAMTFTPPGFTIGCIISAVFFLILIGVMILKKRQGKQCL